MTLYRQDKVRNHCFVTYLEQKSATTLYNYLKSSGTVPSVTGKIQVRRDLWREVQVRTGILPVSSVLLVG